MVMDMDCYGLDRAGWSCLSLLRRQLLIKEIGQIKENHKDLAKGKHKPGSDLLSKKKKKVL